MTRKNKICGIYQIKNLVNDKVYIGQSINIKGRWSEHKTHLKYNKHHNIHLQKAWNKYGRENFKFSILEECNKEDLDFKEIFWINFYKSNISKNGYNLESGGNNNKKISEETKLKRKYNMHGINAKINENQAKDIKILLSKGYSPKEISYNISVNINIVRNIRQGSTFKYLLSELNDKLKTNRERLGAKSEIVKEIKIRLLDLDYYTELEELCDIYNVSINVIYNIRKCITHSYILPELNERLINKKYIGETNYSKNKINQKFISKNKTNHRLTKEEVIEVRKMLDEGKKTNVEIGKIFDVNSRVISNIKHGIRYAKVS